MTRIFFVNHEESLTGAPSILFNIARHFKNDPRYCVVVASKRRGAAHDRFQALPVIYPSESRPFAPMYQTAFETLERWKPDLVYANTVDCYEYALAARVLRIPTILHVHELHLGFENLMASHLLDGEDEERFHRCADRFICPSPEVRDLLVKGMDVANSAVTIISEFIDPDAVRTSARLLPAPKPSGPVVVSCGTVCNRKGLDVFIQIAKRLPHVKFEWIGRIVDEVLDAPSNIEWIGEVESSSPFLADAAVFLLPSLEDPFPLVVLEAMALEVPVITCRLSGGSHWAVRGCGVVLEDLDPNGWSSALSDLLADESGRLALGRLGRERVDRLYSGKTQLHLVEQEVLGALEVA